MMNLIKGAIGLFFPAPAPRSAALDLFIAGASIAQTAAAHAYPGQDMITSQRAVEDDLRRYVEDLEAEIAYLQAQLSTR